MSFLFSALRVDEDEGTDSIDLAFTQEAMSSGSTD